MTDRAPEAAHPPRFRLSAAATALLVITVLGFGGIAWDVRFSDSAEEAGRHELSHLVEVQGRALAVAVQRRLGLVDGLRGWLTTEHGEALQGFELFAAAVYPSVPGVRALQVVEDYTIIHTYPMEGNEGVDGFDLRNHPQPNVIVDLNRTRDTDALVLSPVDSLLQGGRGLVARRRVPGPPGARPRMAALVFDLEPILAEAGLGALTPDDMRFHLRDDSGKEIWSSATEVDESAVEVTVDVEDGVWYLRGMPDDGSVRPGIFAQNVARTFGLLAIGLFGLLAFQVVDRRRRLEAAVQHRTALLQHSNRELESVLDALRAQEDRLGMALRAGGVTTWEWDLAKDEVRHFPGTLDKVDVDPDSGAAAFEAVEGRVHPDDVARFREAIRRTRAEGADFDVEYRVLLPDGSVRWRHDAGRVITGTDCVRGAVADLTRSKELEEELAHAHKLEAVGQLAGGIAHDFNNLMQVVLGHATLLQDDPAPAELDEGLEEVVKAAEHASQLTAQLLTFSRRRAVRPEHLGLASEVRSAATMFQRLLGEQVRIELELDPRPTMILMDPAQLTQVLVNLGVNARDAMPSGGTLTLRTGTRHLDRPEPGSRLAAGEYAVLQVVDEGIGMDSETLARIFDPFFTTKGAGKGTGLGLASVYGTVQQAGGAITVESEPGEGSTFTVLLPEAVTEAAPDSSAPPAPASDGGHSVLLVEDEPAVRRLTLRILERAGHAVVEAGDAVEAQRMVEVEGLEPELLLTDVVLPSDSGPTLARALRERLPDLAVLFVSGYPGDARLSDWLSDPRAAFLEKPFSPDGLRQAMKALLG